MPKKRDQRTQENPPIGDEQTFLLNASEVEKSNRKRMEMKNENKDDEGNMSKLDYELSSYGDLLVKATKPIRGQKQLLKRLYLDVDEVLEKCTVNELRRATYEPCFVISPEGKKLAAHFILKIGLEQFWMLVKKVVTSEKTGMLEKIYQFNRNFLYRMQCTNYGEVLLLAWKNAAKDNAHTLQHQLERIFMDIVYYALQHLRCNKKFMTMLEPFRKARNKQIDAMIYRTFEPNLWRCLKAANEVVRYNACCLFLPFYPLVSDDDIENAENVSLQQGIIINLLKDDSSGIRSEACRRTLFILSTYFDTFPLNFIKQCLTQIIDVLSLDSVVSVRTAVYEGMRDLLRCASALNACERALKCLFDNRGINDRNDRVRLAAFQLLNALVGHRFIKLSEVVKMDRILKVFAFEESNMVRIEIAKLLLPSYVKHGLSPDEVIRRIIVMGQESEIAALSFHHIIVDKNLISVDHAVQHAKSLVLAVYKALRSLEGIDGCEPDEAMSLCSEATACETFIEPVQDETSEKFKLWRSSQMMLNCLVVMWLPLRLTLDNEKYAKENENLRRLLTKLVKFAFSRYRNTSILEAVMHLGKTLDDWKEGKVIVLQELLQSCELDDKKAAIFLEAASNWDFLDVLKFIDSAFVTVKRAMCGGILPKKREKKSKLPDDAFNRSLVFLDRILKQPEMKHHLEFNYTVYVSKYCKSLASLRELILENILQKRLQFSNPTFTFENMIRGIHMQYILAAVILTGSKKDDDEELLKNMQDDIKWLKESVMPEFLTDLNDEQLNMMIKICKTYIYLWTQQLKTYSLPSAFITALCDVQWIQNMENSRGAVQLLAVVIDLFRNLIITVAASNELTEVPVASLSISVFKYTVACSKSSFEDFYRKKIADAWLSIYNILSSCRSLMSNVVAEQAKVIADFVLEEFLETNKNMGITQNPRNPCFGLDEVIDFWINKILLPNRFMRCSVLVYLKDKVESRIPSANTVEEDEIHYYGALIQFLLLLQNSSKKISDSSKNNSMRKDANSYETCVMLLGEQLKRLSCKYEKNEMFFHLDAIFREL